jgi:hypothetical protein
LWKRKDRGHGIKLTLQAREGQPVESAQDHPNRHLPAPPPQRCSHLSPDHLHFQRQEKTRQGFIESDLTGLHNLVSFKVKNTICMRVRSITKKNTIGRPRLKLVQITLFQDEAFAAKQPEMAYLGWSSESQLIRSLRHESSKENMI